MEIMGSQTALTMEVKGQVLESVNANMKHAFKEFHKFS